MSQLDKNIKEHFSQTYADLDLTLDEIVSIEFEACTFKDCNFSEATFLDCKFVDCLFLKCNLSVVNVERSRFLDVMFEECKVVGVDWTKASWSNLALSSPIKFYKSIISDSSFFGLGLGEIAVEECKADGVDFRSADLNNAIFVGTNFSGSLFNDTNLSCADFTDAENYRIDVNYNQIKGAKFSRTEVISLLESLEIELVD